MQRAATTAAKMVPKQQVVAQAAGTCAKVAAATAAGYAGLGAFSAPIGNTVGSHVEKSLQPPAPPSLIGRITGKK